MEQPTSHTLHSIAWGEIESDVRPRRGRNGPRPAAEAATRRDSLSNSGPLADEEPPGQRQTDWLAMLGHQLRNPVGAIANGLELVQSGSLDSGGLARIVKMMQRQVRQAEGLLDDLLDGVRLANGKLEIARESVDLAQVALDAVDTIGPRIDARRHTLAVMLPPAGTLWVLGDYGRLIDVVVNLLDNAAKYTRPGGHVELEMRADAETAFINVRDTGVGIPSERTEDIFDAFVQGEREPGSARGLGLGLALARTLIELHGGWIAAHSAGKDRGSEFEVRLPRMRRINGHAGDRNAA
ncbi:MAG TPA: HAMP domain-containing sensor histidine kinase [Gammaproteobacteria bacterium]|nr:HAMP domain-containing sensor histidine kinase [Gammaproteobacteria bacterium]